jgi:hypothetical protein
MRKSLPQTVSTDTLLVGTSTNHPQTVVDEYGQVKYCRRSKQDAWITSYIPTLLKLIQCHIHVDVCFTANVVLYLYKYLYKGPNTTKFNSSIGRGYATALGDRRLSECLILLLD